MCCRGGGGNLKGFPPPQYTHHFAVPLPALLILPLFVGITPCPVSDRTRLSRPLLTGTARLTALPAHDPTPMVRER